jgi:hypothetical protein
MDETLDEYVPGVCNIGGADVRARATIGWIGVVATVLVAAAVLALDASPAFMLLAAVPSYVAATGHLQARARFCVGYAAAGRYGFGASRGPSGRVEGDANLAADRATARRINGRAAQLTIVVTAPLVLLAWFV